MKTPLNKPFKNGANPMPKPKTRWFPGSKAPKLNTEVFLLVDNKFNPLPKPALTRAILRESRDPILATEYIVLEKCDLEPGKRNTLLQQYDVILWRYVHP